MFSAFSWAENTVRGVRLLICFNMYQVPVLVQCEQVYLFLALAQTYDPIASCTVSKSRLRKQKQKKTLPKYLRRDESSGHRHLYEIPHKKQQIKRNRRSSVRHPGFKGSC